MFEVEFETATGTDGNWWAYARRDDRPTDYRSGWYWGSGITLWDAILNALRIAGRSDVVA